MAVLQFIGLIFAVIAQIYESDRICHLAAIYWP